MAFMPHQYTDGEVRAWTYLAAPAATYTVGQYIPALNAVSMADMTVNADEPLLPVLLTEKGIIFDAPLTVASSGIAVGTAYTVTGAGVTATSSDGVFVVTEFDGKAKDDHVRGYFNK